MVLPATHLRLTSLAPETFPISVRFYTRASIVVVCSSSQSRVHLIPLMARKTWSIRGMQHIMYRAKQMEPTIALTMPVLIWVATWFPLDSSQVPPRMNIRLTMLACRQSEALWVPVSKKAHRVVSIWIRNSRVIASEMLERNRMISTTRSFSYHLCRSLARKV